VPWGAAEREEWRSRQHRKRSYADDVLSTIDRLRARFDVVPYGELDYSPDRYPLFALQSRDRRDDRPIALVTGGVHGYETSGVHGALQFVERHADELAGRIDLVVLPCVSPWGYERIHRWNPFAVDPNRSFLDASPAMESASVIRFVAPWRERVLVHVDLHETTDSDETEHRLRRDRVSTGAGRARRQAARAGRDSGWLLRRRRHRESAAGVPAGDHRRRRRGHAHRAGRRRGQDHRVAGRRPRRHRVSARAARAVRRRLRRALHDHHRGLPR